MPVSIHRLPILPSGSRVHYAARDYRSSTPSKQTTNEPWLRNAALRTANRIMTTELELLELDEKSFWQGVDTTSHKPDPLQDDIRRTNVLDTPTQTYTNWISNLDALPQKRYFSVKEHDQEVTNLPSNLPTNEGHEMRRHITEAAPLLWEGGGSEYVVNYCTYGFNTILYFY